MLNKKPETTGRVIPGDKETNCHNNTFTSSFCQAYLYVLPLVIVDAPWIVGIADRLFREARV